MRERRKKIGCMQLLAIKVNQNKWRWERGGGKGGRGLERRVLRRGVFKTRPFISMLFCLSKLFKNKIAKTQFLRKR